MNIAHFNAKKEKKDDGMQILGDRYDCFVRYTKD